MGTSGTILVTINLKSRVGFSWPSISRALTCQKASARPATLKYNPPQQRPFPSRILSYYNKTPTDGDNRFCRRTLFRRAKFRTILKLFKCLILFYYLIICLATSHVRSFWLKIACPMAFLYDNDLSQRKVEV